MKQHGLMWRGLVGMLLAGLMLAPSLAQAQGSSYDETFDNGAPDWKLDTSWAANNGFLLGRALGSAIYAGQDGWHDAHYKVVIRSLTSAVNFTFMNTGHQWYAVTLQTGDGTLQAQLYYTALGQEFPPILGDTTIQYGADQIKQNGITLEVTVVGRAVDVSLNGQGVIHYDGQVDDPAGTIGFDVFTRGASVAIDEVSVDPAGLVTPTPVAVTETPTPATSGEDLAITGLSLRGVRKGSVIADLTVGLINQGNAGSQTTTLVVYDQSQPSVRIEVPLGPLPAGDARSIDVSLEGPDDWANTARTFVAQIDPNNTLGEADTNNNQFTASGVQLTITTGGGAIPPTTPPTSPNAPGSGPAVDPLPIILGGLGVLALAVVGGTVLTVRSQTQIGDRKKLQKEAQQGKPPDQCTPPGRYVEVETSVDLKLMKVTQVGIDLIDPHSRVTRRTETVKDKVPAELNASIRGYWLHEPENRLAERMSGLAKGLSRAVEQAAYREKEALDVRVTAHLEGIELTTTFTLYNCKKQGADGVWKKVASWDVKKQTQRDDTLFGLEQLDTDATSMAMRLEVLITPLLLEYMKRY